MTTKESRPQLVEAAPTETPAKRSEVNLTRATPNIVYGRLLESTNISGYAFERACTELEWLLDNDRWQQVGPGFKDINDFLATVDLTPFNLTTDQKKPLAQKLTELHARQSATAKALGVSQGTVSKWATGRRYSWESPVPAEDDPD